MLMIGKPSAKNHFDAFIAEVLKSECEDGDFVAHRCQNKGNYLVKRLQVPVSDRDRLYSKSGKNSVTFRQARGPFDPDEPDLEIIKIEDSPPDTRLVSKNMSISRDFLVYSAPKVCFIFGFKMCTWERRDSSSTATVAFSMPTL